MPGQYAGSRLYKEMHSMPRSTVQELYRQIALPVISAPMFIVSGPELVIAQCASGIIGSMPALNARPQGVLTQWLTQIETALAELKAQHPQRAIAPYAINHIIHKSNDRLAEDQIGRAPVLTPVTNTHIVCRL